MDYSGEEIIRLALINEQEGYEFYNMAARNTDDQDLKDFFESLAEQENQHKEWLHDTFMDITSQRSSSAKHEQMPVSVGIFNTKKLSQIGAGELSSIHAAILLEKESMDYYKNAAKSTEHEAAMELFNKLVLWESNHLDALQQIYDLARDDWWDRQRFSPA